MGIYQKPIQNLPICFKWNQMSRKTHERRFNRNMNENICGKQNEIHNTVVLNWLSKVNMRLLWFCFTTLSDWFEKLAPVLSQSDAKLKPIGPWLHGFSRAWRKLHVFASSSDWFVVLFSSVVIGQSDYFRFGFTSLNRPFSKMAAANSY